MAEEGIDIAGRQPKILTTDAVKAPTSSSQWDAATPAPLSQQTLGRWTLEDPAGKESVETVRRVRDEIRGRVRTP